MKGILVLALAGVLVAPPVYARRDRNRGPDPETDLQAALDRAEAENKLLFIQYGRQACGNCQALKTLIRQRKVRIQESKFVYADICCDDPATGRLFSARFTVEGRMLPFVVIADSSGKQLAARSGYGKAAEYNRLIREARREAARDAEEKESR